MNAQTLVESAISTLIGEFLQDPFMFFTEADAVSRFHQLLTGYPEFGRTFVTSDGFTVNLVHREYPTFFRFTDKNPTARLGPPARRGHYDTVILNPDFIKAHPASTVLNRDISAPRDASIVPFQAVIEFKLDNQGWSSGRSRGAIAELGKLRLSEESPLRYCVILMRFTATTMRRWEKYWPAVKTAAQKNQEIATVIAVHWLGAGRDGHDVFHFGPWE